MEPKAREQIIQALNELRDGDESVTCVVTVHANFFNDVESHQQCRVKIGIDEQMSVADVAEHIMEASRRAVRAMLKDIQDQVNGEDDDFTGISG